MRSVLSPVGWVELCSPKLDTKADQQTASSVGERSAQRGSRTERSGGACRSENAGMSSEKHVRNMFAVNLRVPTEG